MQCLNVASSAKVKRLPTLFLVFDRGLGLDMEPSNGEEIQALIKELMEQKREVIERVKKHLEN